MGNAHGHHGDHQRKHSGQHSGQDGLIFTDKGQGRENSPFDPVSYAKKKLVLADDLIFSNYDSVADWTCRYNTEGW